MDLNIYNLSKTHNAPHNGGSLDILTDISMQVKSGEFISIVGPSGCGKTTLIEIVAGLQKKSGGSIRIDGVALESSTANCAIVFQQYGLFSWLTVEKNIQFGPMLKGISKKKRRSTSTRLIETVGLKGFERHYPHELSGGMQQRVALARALANSPDVLFLDEPFAALDAQTREDCQQELLKLWRKMGITIVFVTHDITEAVFLSDRIYVMSAQPGTIKESIDIDLERPRDISLITSEGFRSKEAYIRQILKQEKERICYA